MTRHSGTRNPRVRTWLWKRALAASLAAASR
jgi:hypothetical protein